MKYLHCLIVLPWILCLIHFNQNEPSVPPSGVGNKIYYLESTSNVPLSAIETSVYSLSPVNSDFKNYSFPKLLFLNFSKKGILSLAEIVQNKIEEFFHNKSISLFLLFNSSAFLLKVILC
jgi:hypothetical protein